MMVSLLLLVLSLAAPLAASASGDGRVNVVLVGATGNLAQKYLWQVLFDTQAQEGAGSFGVFAGATQKPEKGEPKVREILGGNITCARGKSAQPAEGCEARMDTFGAAVPYFQLRGEKHYAALDAAVRAATAASGQAEAGRIFYLSVPPKFYGSIAELIHKHARPHEGGWLRVVFEKPFGSDVASARDLAAQLTTAGLVEPEIYRIDHYLGKVGVQSIGAFRMANRHMDEEFLHNGVVERVEVVMAEKENCEGRTGFYDKYGVVRDVLQNHLTEMLALLTLDLPADHDPSDRELLDAKVALLRSVTKPTSRDAILGQYAAYDAHVREDRARWAKDGEIDDAPNTRMPTYANVRLEIDNDRWRGVPFYLIAGKELDERRAYLRVVMKSDAPGIQGKQRQLLFNVQGGPAREEGGSTFVGRSGFKASRDTLPGFEEAHDTVRNTMRNVVVDTARGRRGGGGERERF